MDDPRNAVPFTEVSAVRATGRGGYAADVHPAWTVDGKPNGGYLLALAARAALAVVPHPHVLTAGGLYLHSPDPGPVILDTEVLRAGRSADQVRVRLSQPEPDGSVRPCVEAVFTVSTLDRGGAPAWTGGAVDPGTGEYARGLRLSDDHPAGLPLPIYDQVDVRMDRDTAGYVRGDPSGAGELRGWLALPGEDFDPVSLLFAVDAFPPATLDIAPTGWVPTLELTVYVRALPAPGPVRVVQRAGVIDAQKVDETCVVYDGAGRLVAQATQLAGVRIG